MSKKLAILALLLVFGIGSYAQAAKDYGAELEQQKKELSGLESKIEAQRNNLRELSKEFNDSDIALRQKLISLKPEMDRKTHIRESKRRERQLRQEHNAKLKPAKAEYDRLKVAHRNTKKKIRSLEKKIDRLAADPESESYNKKINALRQKMQDTNDEMHAGIEDVYAKADRQIDKITDMSNKSRIRSQILSDAKTEELALRKQYKERRHAISAQIDKTRSEYRKNLAEFRARQAKDSRAQVQDAPETKSKRKPKEEQGRRSSPETNFGTAR